LIKQTKISEDDGRFGSVFRREIRREEMDKHRRAIASSSGSIGEALGGSGDEASDDGGGDLRFSRRTKRRRHSPCSTRHSRCHPPSRRRRFTSIERFLHPQQAQAGKKKMAFDVGVSQDLI